MLTAPLHFGDITLASGPAETGREGDWSSRFYEAIVRQKQLAPTVNAFADESRGPGLFSVFGIVTPGRTVADLEAAIDLRLSTRRVSPASLRALWLFAVR